MKGKICFKCKEERYQGTTILVDEIPRWYCVYCYNKLEQYDEEEIPDVVRFLAKPSKLGKYRSGKPRLIIDIPEKVQINVIENHEYEVRLIK